MKKKKTCLVIVVLLSVTSILNGAAQDSWQNSTARVFVARHGQPEKNRTNAKYNDTDNDSRDPILSALGREQAKLLGEHLRSIGFKGEIYSSPYRRTLETADIVAEILNSQFWVMSDIQEYNTGRWPAEFNALTIGEIKKRYPHVAAEANLSFPWLISGPEKVNPDVISSVKRTLQATLLKQQNQSAIYICHGAVTDAFYETMKELATHIKPYIKSFNCALSVYQLDKHGNCEMRKIADYSFIPDEKVTSNGVFLKNVVKAKTVAGTVK
ncbi:MAG: histidine phosphatase family protein [Victivallaceae bacterium]